MTQHDQAALLDSVTVIVVAYNSAHCVPSLAQTLAAFSRAVVVDNASEDATLALVRQYAPHVRVIANTRNLGFGAANNLGLAQVKTPYALLLNPDCSMGQAAATQLLDAAATFPEAAIIAPQLTAGDGRRRVDYRWQAAGWSSRGPGADAACCVGFVCGAAMLLNMRVMHAVGFLDESFFLYYEDDDLCMRVRACGLSIVVEPSAQAVHQSRGSVGRTKWWRSEFLRGYHHAQSKIRLMVKYPEIGNPRKKCIRLLMVALLALPVRMVLVSPRHVCRLAGRIAGLAKFKLS